MKSEVVNAKSKVEAMDICSWAATAIECESGDDGEMAWMCFESMDDARNWEEQE